MINNLLIKGINLKNLVWGLITGFFLAVYPAAIFYILLVIILIVALYEKLDSQERSFIMSIFYGALFLRLIIILIMHIMATYYGIGPKSPTFPGMEGGAIIGDDIGIHQRAIALSNVINKSNLSEMKIKILLDFGHYGWNPLVYILGFFYYIFGIVPLLGKCVNALLGVLTGITAYFIAKELFGTKTAKLAFILTVFYPTLFLWSIANLKDTMLIFLLTFALYCYIAFLRKRKVVFLFLLLLSFFLINEYRPDLIYALILALVISLFVNIKLSFRRIISFSIIFTIIFCGLFFYRPSARRIKPALRKINIEQFTDAQKGFVSSGGMVYKIYPERFYSNDSYSAISAGEFITALIKGAVFLMFKPFPWEMSKKIHLIYYPISIIWDILVIFFTVGLFMCFRYRVRGSIFLLSLFFIIAAILSLSEGNIGTMIRHRDMLTPIFLIISSFGIVSLIFNQDLRRVK